MNIIKWFATRKEREASKEAAEKLRIDTELTRRKKLGSDRLRNQVNNMCNTYCPINGKNCEATCIHFYAGSAGAFHIYSEFTEEFHTYYNAPKCKLQKC